MIALFTDFGLEDPYAGQLHAVLAEQAPGVPVIDLFHAVPAFDIRAAAYLLPAYTAGFPPSSVFVCVVDPGVGGPRRAVYLHADGCWYVGPDNGLFHILARRAREYRCYELTGRPARLSASFHGRDLFAPAAAQLARGRLPPGVPAELTAPAGGPWPDDLAQILYVDHYGNAVTGLRAAAVPRDARLEVHGHPLGRAETFSDVPPGRGFWYENANGLVECAVNQGRADRALGLRLGDPVRVRPAGG